MLFHLLGTVELSARGTVVRLESDKVRCLAAALAIDVGRPVPLDTLITRLWDDEPPSTARATAHSYISRLRSALRAAQQADADGPSAEIVRQAHTYTLKVDPQQVDWVRYLQLGRRARSLADAGEDRQAIDVLGRAEDGWRGDPLAGLPGEWAQATRNTMLDQRLATTLVRFEVELRLGRFVDVIPELRALARQRPTDERVAGHLITALYGSGRQAEALSVFQRTRRELREYLGTEPGEQLRLLQHRVLHRVPLHEVLPRPRGAVTPPGTAAGPPAQRSHLPALHRMVGREAELRRILSAADQGRRGRSNGVNGTTGANGGIGHIGAVSGMAGAGKTRLVVTAAHLLQDRFPEGQHYVDLRANGGAQQPLETEAVATLLLRQFGVPATEMPTDPDALTSHCRDLLAKRRAVVVLDDARGPAQVRALLPGTPASFILITSRHRLAALPCIPLFLDALSLEDAVELFTVLVGEERADDPEGVEAVVDLCARLPLALELIASRFKAHSSWTLQHLARRLSGKRGRLNELHHGFESMAMAFDVSYQGLPGVQQEAFRRLGLHPGSDFGLGSAAALIGRPAREADHILECLHDLHMIQEISPERYALHDLLREFAVDLVSAEERDQAIRRLVSFALQMANRAGRHLNPRGLRLEIPALPGLSPADSLLDELDWQSDTSIRTWLKAELPGLVAVENHARATGMPEEAAWLAHALADLLYAEGLWREATEMHRAASEHWRTHGVSLPESHALVALSAIRIRTARYPAAEEAAERALDIARSGGDTACAAEALKKLSEIRWHQSDLTSALSFQRQALDIHRKSGDTWNRTRSLNNIGAILLNSGNHEAALASFTEALPLATEMGDSRLKLLILGNLGGIHLSTRNPSAARDAFEQILAIGEDILSPNDFATVRVNLANSLPLPEEADRAAELLTLALHTYREAGNRRSESDALNGLGTVLRETGRLDAALDRHRSALDLARSIGAQREEATALRGLGQTENSLGHASAALDHLHRAVALSRQIGDMEEEAYARESLAELQLGADPGRAAE
ncbi:AfsR/SARP family transcriptional regulator [Kitasatospora sp. NPDC101183]|uniref:AfsR/SARP family transcriptional regulator n=1 Tax=Kitasatospora sp. NPDC101183 TaxID=3364100 RepID=UPI0038185AB4